MRDFRQVRHVPRIAGFFVLLASFFSAIGSADSRCLFYGLPVSVEILEERDRWRKEGSAMLSSADSKSSSSLEKETTKFCSCAKPLSDSSSLRTAVFLDREIFSFAHVSFVADLPVGERSFRTTVKRDLSRCLEAMSSSISLEGALWRIVAAPAGGETQRVSNSPILLAEERAEFTYFSSTGNKLFGSSPADTFDRHLSRINSLILTNSGVATVKSRGQESTDFSWRLFLEITAPGPPGKNIATCPIEVFLGPVSISFVSFSRRGKGGTEPSKGDFSPLLLSKKSGDPVCKDVGCSEEGAECGLSNCERECGRGCRDGKYCDYPTGTCQRLEHPGSCSNSWIFMQLGTDDKGVPFRPDEADLARSVGGTVDQSKTYALPSRKPHVRFVPGRLEPGMGRAQSPPSCADRNGWTNFYVFEAKELVGVSIDVTGAADGFSNRTAGRWGSLDTVLEIKNFGGYCAPVRDIPNLGKPETGPGCTEAIETEGEGSWFLPLEGSEGKYGLFRHCHFQSPCNDDGGRFATADKPARKTGFRRGSGKGSRVEAWLVPGIYTLVVGGWDYDAKGSYEIFFKSVPGCLPRCGLRECGKEPTCGTSCGKCGPEERCVADRCQSVWESEADQQEGPSSTNVCDERNPICKVPAGKSASDLERIAWCASDCRWRRLSAERKDLPDLMVGFEKNAPAAEFRWVYVKGGTNVYHPGFCVHSKPQEEENGPLEIGGDCESGKGSEEEFRFPRGCFGGTGWRLMMLPNFFVANLGSGVFSSVPTSPGTDENDWVWSKCGQYKARLRMKIGFVETRLRLPEISQIVEKSEEKESPGIFRRSYLAEGPTRFSRRSFYETRRSPNATDDGWLPSGLGPGRDAIKLSPGGAFFSSDSKSLPCNWVDVTEEYKVFARVLSDASVRLCGCRKTLEIVVRANWAEKNSEKDSTNNEATHHLSWHDVPAYPTEDFSIPEL